MPKKSVQDELLENLSQSVDKTDWAKTAQYVVRGFVRFTYDSDLSNFPATRKIREKETSVHDN